MRECESVVASAAGSVVLGTVPGIAADYWLGLGVEADPGAGRIRAWELGWSRLGRESGVSRSVRMLPRVGATLLGGAGRRGGAGWGGRSAALAWA